MTETLEKIRQGLGKKIQIKAPQGSLYLVSDLDEELNFLSFFYLRFE